MGDQSKPVACPDHGQSYATFVCQHLVKGKGLGYFCADDKSDPCPDAWCGACDRMREKERGWNDRSEAFAKVTMICAGCYQTVKARNRIIPGTDRQ